MPELEGGAGSLGEKVQELLQAVEVLLEVGRKLEENHAEPGPEGLEGFEQVGRLLLGALEALEVGDPARGLDREAEVIGHLRCPGLEHARLGQTVEGVVDLDGGKLRCVKPKHLAGRQVLGVEAPLPLLVAVSARSDAQVHRYRPYRRPVDRIL